MQRKSYSIEFKQQLIQEALEAECHSGAGKEIDQTLKRQQGLIIYKENVIDFS